MAFIVHPGRSGSRVRMRRAGLAPSLAGGSACPWRAGSASRPAFPGGALALQGVEDHVVDDGAVGAAQGH